MLWQKESASLYLAEQAGGDRAEKPSSLAGVVGERRLRLGASALREKERSLRNSYLCATYALLLVQGCSFHTYYIGKIMTIAPNKFVSVEYELYVGDENERVLMEQSISREWA